MADSEQIIRLSGQEDIHAIRTLLTRVQARRVLLLVPKYHPALQRLVRVKLLARQAYDLRLQLALVTKDRAIRNLANQVNLSTFGSVKAGRRARRWRRGQQPKVQAVSDAGQLRDLEWQRGRRAVLERRRQIGRRSNWTEHIMLAGLVFGVMIVLSAVLLLFVPSAQILLVPSQVSYDAPVPITIDPTAREIDFGDFVIPGEVISQDVQGTFEIATTGRRDVPAETAKGTVLLINITGQEVSVPDNTIISTSAANSIRFRTIESVVLASEINATASVPIEAIRPGPSGNVGAQQINRVEGAAATAVRVLNEQPIGGGTVQQRAVVLASDREQLKEQLRQRLLQEGRVALETSREGTDESIYLVSDLITMEILSENFNGSVGDQLDILRLDLRARVSGITISLEDVERLARRQARFEAPENHRMLEDGFAFTPGITQVIDNGLPEMAVQTQAIFGAELSGDEIRTLVRGQPLDEAQAALLQRLPLAADPAITITPEWWERMPYLSLRIFIRVGVLGAEQN